jgi:predicted transcriptional regulator
VPRNDQITRQWHLLRLLEGSQGKSLQELVEAVPDDYPKNARTVRRDIPSLAFSDIQFCYLGEMYVAG